MKVEFSRKLAGLIYISFRRGETEYGLFLFMTNGFRWQFGYQNHYYDGDNHTFGFGPLGMLYWGWVGCGLPDTESKI